MLSDSGEILTHATLDSAPAAPDGRDREIAHLAFNFVLDVEAHGIPGLKALEAVLMMAINQANIAPLTRDPAARSRYGALDHPAADQERRPVSVRAVAASMQLPYETARRNIRRMEAQGVCIVSEAGVIVPTAYLMTSDYLQAVRVAHDRAYALFRMLRTRGLLDPLPSPNYDESEPPVRGAVRLVADYLLRVSDALVGRTGDLVTTLVALPVLAQAAGGNPGAPPPPLSIAAISRRVQLPAETVRRHAAALAASGLCDSSRSGLALVPGALAEPAWRSLLRDNAVAVQRMFAGLAERGVVAAWEQADGGAARAEGVA